MTAEELAVLLNGRSYGSEISSEEERQAKDSGLVVVFGASDDLVEFRGAISDEAYGPGTVAITRDGLLTSKCGEGDDCPYFRATRKGATLVEAKWCENTKAGGPPWVMCVPIRHSEFEIQEDDEPYCRGIVFSVSVLRQRHQRVRNGGNMDGAMTGRTKRKI